MLWSVSSSTDKLYPGKPSLATTQEEALAASSGLYSGLYSNICHILYDFTQLYKFMDHKY